MLRRHLQSERDRLILFHRSLKLVSNQSIRLLSHQIGQARHVPSRALPEYGVATMIARSRTNRSIDVYCCCCCFFFLSLPICVSSTLCVGVDCRDGNNATIDPSVCLSKLMDDYRQLETHRPCHVACRAGSTSVKSECHHYTIPESSKSLCPRNCIGTRIISGMCVCLISFEPLSLSPFQLDNTPVFKSFPCTVIVSIRRECQPDSIRSKVYCTKSILSSISNRRERERGGQNKLPLGSIC